MKKFIKFLSSALMVLPAAALAQSGVQLTKTIDLVNSAGNLVERLIVVVAGIALLAFFWGLVKFIFAQGSETSKVESKKIMGWSLIALFVMVSVWGLIRFITFEIFGNFDNRPIPVPTFFQP